MEERPISTQTTPGSRPAARGIIRRRLGHLVGGLTAITVLAACGGDPAGEADQSDPSSGATPTPSAGTAPTIQLSVPEGIYDTSRGWESELPASYAVLPHASVIASFPETRYPDKSSVTAVEVASGDTVWTSVPLGPPNEDVFALESGFGTTVRGEDYFVVSGSGEVGGDALTKAEDVTIIYIFTATGSGDAVEPAHHIEVAGQGTVRDGGGGLIVDHGGGVTSVDPATGATETYQREELEPPSACIRCRQSVLGDREVVAITSAGPLVSSGPDGGFWVPDAWSSDTLAPDDPYHHVTLISDDLLTVGWYVADTGTWKWGFLDGATGEIDITVECQPIESTNVPDYYAQLSSNQRYLAGARMVLDRETGTSHCYEGNDTDKAVGFTSPNRAGVGVVCACGVTDTGIAFGQTTGDGDEEEATPVLVDIETGEVTAADPTWVFPAHDVGGFGLFEDLSSDVLVAYPHAR